MSFSFEKLKVYQKSLEFNASIYKATDRFPVSERYGLTGQLQRAAASIPANIAEGAGRESKKDRKRYYIMARSSLFECIPLMTIASQLGFISSRKISALRAECEEISKMLRGLIKSLE